VIDKERRSGLEGSKGGQDPVSTEDTAARKVARRHHPHRRKRHQRAGGAGHSTHNPEAQPKDGGAVWSSSRNGQWHPRREGKAGSNKAVTKRRNLAKGNPPADQ